MIGSVAESTLSIGTVTGQVGETTAEGAVVSDAVILWVAGSPLATTGTFIFRAVDTEMAYGMTLKTTSLRSRDRFWAQAGIMRCNLRRVRGCVTLMEGRSCISKDVRRNVE